MPEFQKIATVSAICTARRSDSGLVCGFSSQGADLVFLLADQWLKFLHFLGEPADFWIVVVTAAGLFHAIAAEEGPVLRPPVIEPEAVFGGNQLSKGLGVLLLPGAVPGKYWRMFQPKFFGECQCNYTVSARSQLKPVFSEAFALLQERGIEVD